MTNNTTPRFPTREGWLVAAVVKLASEVFEPVGIQVPGVRVSVGWPGGRGKKNSVIGQCWAAEAAADRIAQIFVSPVLDDAARVLDVLAHELIHAICGAGVGHRGEFARIAKRIGLTGPMTATVAGEELKALLTAIADELGMYPHAALVDPTAGVKKQSTRMLKVECAMGSGCIVRMTRKWLDEYGAPSCPCHGFPMLEAA